ncbi:YadA-like family protein [Escherichia coli :H15]
MKFKKSYLYAAIMLAINPVLLSQVEAADGDYLKVDENKTTGSTDQYSDNWGSIAIGVKETVTKDPDKGINFDHKPPTAEGRNSIAIGTSAEAGKDMQDKKSGEAIAIGAKAQATKEQSIAIGGDTKATGWGAIVIGGDDLTPLKNEKFGNKTIPDTYVASEAKGIGSIVIGPQSQADSDLSVAIGSISSAKGKVSTALGATSEATGNYSGAFGFNAVADGEQSMALGAFSKTTNKNSVSIGSNSVDKLATSVKEATIQSANNASVTYKNFAGSAPDSVVSVGDQGKERQIVNVAAGNISTTSTDAINGSQLYSIAKTLKDDLDAINPSWTLKDEKNTTAVIDKNKNALTVKGTGDITVSVNGADTSMTIDGSALKDTIKQNAIKIKGDNGKTLTKNLGDEIDISGGNEQIKTQVVNDKLTIVANTAAFNKVDTINNDGKVTVNTGDDNKLVTAKNIADAVNNSGWKIQASNAGGQLSGAPSEQIVKPGDIVTLEAGKNINIKQEKGNFTFSTVDSPSFTSVILNDGNGGDVSLSTTGNKLNLSSANNNGKEIVISGVGSGLEGKKLSELTETDSVLKNAASVADLKTAMSGLSSSLEDAEFGIKDKNGQEIKQKLGKSIQITGDSNIITTSEKNGDPALKISLNNDLTLGNENTAGSIKINGSDNKEAIKLDGNKGSIFLSTPDKNGVDNHSVTISVANGKAGIGDNTVSKTRLNYVNTENVVEEVATLNDGLSFKGDHGNVVTKKLNETLTIKGEAKADEDIASGNIRVDSENGGLFVRMTKNLRDLASAIFGTGTNTTTVNDNGVTIKNGDGNNVKTVTLTSSGLDNGGNQITNVASGLNGTKLEDANGTLLTNAANIGDLQNALNDTHSSLINKGFGLQADDGQQINKTLGDYIAIGGDDKNISTSINNGKLSVSLSDNISLTDKGSITVGDTKIYNEGITINGGPSITKQGIDAAGNVITGVKDGVDENDAVNVSQLNKEIKQATAATTWGLKTSASDDIVQVSSQTVEIRDGKNTQVSAIRTDEKGNYSYEIDVTGIPMEYTDSLGNPLINIGGRFYTQTEDAETGKLTMTPAEPARVRISSDHPLVLNNMAAGQVSSDSTDGVNGSQLASVGNVIAGDKAVWKDGKATLSPDTFNELTTAAGENKTVSGDIYKSPDNVAAAVNILNKEGTKYFKASSTGPAAKAEGRNSIAIGQNAVSRVEDSIALGHGAEVTNQAVAGSVAIGNNSRAGRAHTGSYTINGQSVAGKTGSNTAVVSFGQPGQERQLQSVAPGVISANSTDAVNGSQLHATNSQVSSNTQEINTLGNKFSQLSYRVEELNKDIRGVGASAAAMSGIPQAYLPGKSLMGLGVGGYGGESAIAIGVSRISDNGKVIMKLNAGQNTRGNFSVGAGVGWQW